MSDKELLELAAKAAGLTIKRWAQENYAVVNDGDKAYGWSPLIYDSDALRLAVELNLWYAVRDGYRHADSSDKDPCAATRRSITRAAAEIGRNMK